MNLCRLLGHVNDPIAADYGYYVCRDCGIDLQSDSRLRWVWWWHLRWIVGDWWRGVRDWFTRCPCCKQRFGKHNDACMPF